MKHLSISFFLSVIVVLLATSRSHGQSGTKPSTSCFTAASLNTQHGQWSPVRSHPGSPIANGTHARPSTVERGGGPPNDEACDVTVDALAVGSTLAWSGSLAGATDSEGLGVNTVWQTFTLTECADVELNWCGSSPIYDPYLAYVMNGSCDALGALIAASPNTTDCGDGNPVTTFPSLNAGTYFVLIADVDGSEGTYNIAASATAAICAPVPPNDVACDVVPQALAIGGSISATGTLAGAFDSEFWGYDNVWEAFTLAECADVTFNWCGSSEPTVGIYTYVFGGDCADPTVGSYHPYVAGASCGEVDNLLRTVHTLAPGTYYMLISDDLGTAASYELEMTAATCQPAPASDLCGGLVPVALPIGDTLTFAGSFIAATATGDFETGSALDSLNKPTVWHSFTTAECSNVTLRFCDWSDEWFGSAWMFLTTMCAPGDEGIIPGSWDNSSCGNFLPTITFWELPAGTYNLPIAQWFSIIFDYSVDVSATACSAPCAAWAMNGTAAYEKISNVTFAGIDNDSESGPGYEDFTQVEGDAMAGQSYPLTIEVANGYELDEVLVWLDSDLDSLFSTDELISTSLGAGPFTTNVTIPSDALTGAARLRVRLHDTNPANGPNAEPCGGASYGQVEDYTVNISNTTGLNERGITRPSVYPNPSNGDFTVQVDPRATQANITVIDPAGRIVLQQVVRNMSNGLVRLNAMGTMEPGPYIVRVDDGQVVSDHQVVVQQ